MRYSIDYSCISHIGLIRSMNQDNFSCNGQYMEPGTAAVGSPITGTIYSDTPSLFGVFDGMGGHESGEIASYICAKEASETILTKDGVSTLSEYCKRSNEKICSYAESNSIFSMGTTAAILMFTPKEITLCNVGDSKVFRLSDTEITQISKDHVVMSAYGVKPPLSQNLGIPPEQMVIEPYLSIGKYENGDRYLICSDGLTDMLSVDEIKENMACPSVKDAVLNMINLALENGGKDNATIILLDIKRAKNKFFNLFGK